MSNFMQQLKLQTSSIVFSFNLARFDYYLFQREKNYCSGDVRTAPDWPGHSREKGGDHLIINSPRCTVPSQPQTFCWKL